jgi:hypothetical protein
MLGVSTVPAGHRRLALARTAAHLTPQDPARARRQRSAPRSQAAAGADVVQNEPPVVAVPTFGVAERDGAWAYCPGPLGRLSGLSIFHSEPVLYGTFE